MQTINQKVDTQLTIDVPRTGVWQARFDPAICATCPFQQEGRCPTKPQKRDLRYLLSFTAQEVLTAKRRKEYLAHKGDGHNLRSEVESTVRSKLQIAKPRKYIYHIETSLERQGVLSY